MVSNARDQQQTDLQLQDEVGKALATAVTWNLPRLGILGMLGHVENQQGLHDTFMKVYGRTMSVAV